MASSSRKGPDLTGKLTAIAQKRITKERVQLEKDSKGLEECGIYVHWSDELHKPVALIVGPGDTPYEGGFYFFDVQFTDNYPMSPPHVLFKTGDGRVRFNPNLYVDGKVCLSILGTWQGPSWSTSGQLRTVLVSIQSLLSDHPIQNEPGFENEAGDKDKLYSEIIRYENIAVAVVRMLEHTPKRFEAFRPQMRRVFLQNFDMYMAAMDAYKGQESQSVRSPLWRFSVTFKPKEVAQKLLALQQQLLVEESAASSASASEPSRKPEGQVASADDAATKKRRTQDQ
mmetsp:Transcript_67220/g.161066  ORF Transcript_67220/g.161066 Transcript_67220/m.161066 type:complete len:284 (+) Transcript_67220:251-1102(+)